MEKCFQLKSLSLGLNKISCPDEISFIANLEQLRDLVLSGNPFIEDCNKYEYREHVLSYVKQLQYLDNLKISQDERNRSKMLIEQREIDGISGVTCSIKFADANHPLERILISFTEELGGCENNEVQAALDKFWTIIRDFIKKLWELRKTFSKGLQDVKDAIQYRTDETIEDIVEQKNEITSATNLSLYDRGKNQMMDTELELAKKNLDTIVNELSGTSLQNLIESLSEETENAISSFSSITASLQKQHFSAQSTCIGFEKDQLASSSIFDEFLNQVQIGLKQMEQKEIASANKTLESLILKIEMKHNLRVCQIFSLTSH